MILSRFPYPLDKGDRLRAYHQLRFLSQHYDIFLYCLHRGALEEPDRKIIAAYCTQLTIYPLSLFAIGKGIVWSLFKNLPVQVGYFFSPAIKKPLQADLRKHGIDTVYCQLSRTALYAQDVDLYKVIDFQDAFSTNYLRLSENTGGFYRWFYHREHRTMKAFELQILHWFNRCTIISQFDKEQIDPVTNKIVTVSNGVDTGYFQPKIKAKKYDIVFVGNLSYLPNKTAALYLIKKLLPLLKAQKPSIRINIAGADTPKELFLLSDENVTVSGFAEDIRDVYQDAKIFVAPLFTGAGLQNKILEAMSSGVPCVTTPIVNASVEAEQGSEILIADDEQTFCDHIFHLLHDEELQQKISYAARIFVEKQFSWQRANEKLLGIL